MTNPLRRPRPSRLLALLLLAAGCNGAGATAPADGGEADLLPPRAAADPSRDILGTALAVDLTTLSATATITLAPAASRAASFEAGGLSIKAVRDAIGPLDWTMMSGRLDVGVRDGAGPATVIVDYAFVTHADFAGLLPGGSTLIWPYFCGNLFPCHADPRDGTTFALRVTGAPMGQTSVYPDAIPSDAPSYMLAWSTGPYAMIEAGTTAAGTRIVAYHLPGGEAAAQRGTATLRDVFDWYEKQYGPYLFGAKAGPVAARWPPGAYGGMEHHPLWHVAVAAMGDATVQAHEAAHGWFGDGVRIACWEDFALSEGTASYLAARAIGVVAGPAEAQKVWDAYDGRLTTVSQANVPQIAWPDSCGRIDILKENYFSDVPYMKGAFFLRALEGRIGAPAVDAALRAFYLKFKARAAGYQNLLDTIKSTSGYDPAACAAAWLRGRSIPADRTTCP